MKATLFIVFSFLFYFAQSSIACDVCGSGGGQVGLLYNYNQNFIRVSYGFSEFTSVTGYNSYITDRFKQVDISLRHTLGRKWRVTCQLPYIMNSRTSSLDVKQDVNGLGDLQVGLLRILLPSMDISEKATLYLEAGGTLKIPTGKFDHNIHDRNLPENFNSGRGSMGYRIQSNAVLNRQNIGLVFHASTTFYGRTKRKYKFGQETLTQLVGFRKFTGKKASWIPNMGLSYEMYGKNKYRNNKAVHATGSQQINALAALQVKYEGWSVSGAYTLPIYQKYEQPDVDMSARFRLQFSIIF